ncbi:MAG: phage portal protein [Methanobrevibacter sp.]|nr:phage portal protein [Methanobrevibacter sp.]
MNTRADSFAQFCEENIITVNDKDIDEYHTYLNLIENSKTFSEFDFWRDVISDYDIYGQVYIFLLRRVVYEEANDIVKGKIKRVSHIGLPVSIEVLNANKMTTLKTDDGKVVGYRERIDSTHAREFFPEQIIHVVNRNPQDRTKPYSIFDACKTYQYTINKGAEFAQNALINNINTPGIISTDEVLTDAEYDNLISRINSHEPGKAIVTDGTGKLNYLAINQNIDSAALPSLTEISRQTIFAVTGTSKTVLGIEESGTTRETARVQEKKFIRRTIAPIAHRFVSALNFDFRTRYADIYKSNHVHLEIKATYDPVETQEQFATQKMLFDNVMELVYSGYTKDSAEKFMYGDISFTDLKLDSEDAETIDEEQDSIDEENREEIENDNPEDTQRTPEKTQNSLDKITLHTQEHSHSHDEIPDNYYRKALKMHENSQGELDEYGQFLDKKLAQAQNALLAEVKKIQLDAIKTANRKVITNAFEIDDVSDKQERESIFNRLFKALKKYWMFVLPLIGRERLAEDEFNLHTTQKVNLLGTKRVNDYVKEVSEKAAQSHTNTIFKTIVDAANKAEENEIETEFAKRYIEQYKKQPQVEWFKKTPSVAAVKRKLQNEAFKAQNNELYLEVQRKIAEGLNRVEIQKAIRRKYNELSKSRADLLVRNEMARAVNNSQFIADLELLRKNGLLDKAYKQLVSSTGDPCPVCQAIINEGPVPFMQPFLSLGDTIQVSADGRTMTFMCNYENIDSGIIHPNCHCSYQLILNGLNDE